jgi:hypothetical protein
MYVAISDRPTWLARVQNAIGKINQNRTDEDAVYVARYNAPRWWRKEPTALVPPANWPDYPSTSDWGARAMLHSMKAALLSEGSGTVWISGEEIASLNHYEIEATDLYVPRLSGRG